MVQFFCDNIPHALQLLITRDKEGFLFDVTSNDFCFWWVGYWKSPFIYQKKIYKNNLHDFEIMYMAILWAYFLYFFIYFFCCCIFSVVVDSKSWYNHGAQDMALEEKAFRKDNCKQLIKGQWTGGSCCNLLYAKWHIL